MCVDNKICCSCKKELPRTKDNFFARKIKQYNANGVLKIYTTYRSDCKTCIGQKAEKNRIKKRCKELNCDVSEYRANWKKQYSETRTIDIEAKNKLSEGQYNVYKKMVSYGIVNNLDEYRNEVFKNKHSKPWLRKFDYEGKVFLTSKERADKSHSVRRDKLTDTYIVNALGFKKGELPNEIIETKRLIIKLKRQVNHGN